jgi:hypothetical protein
MSLKSFPILFFSESRIDMPVGPRLRIFGFELVSSVRVIPRDTAVTRRWTFAELRD